MQIRDVSFLRLGSRRSAKSDNFPKCTTAYPAATTRGWKTANESLTVQQFTVPSKTGDKHKCRELSVTPRYRQGYRTGPAHDAHLHHVQHEAHQLPAAPRLETQAATPSISHLSVGNFSSSSRTSANTFKDETSFARTNYWSVVGVGHSSSRRLEHVLTAVPHCVDDLQQRCQLSSSSGAVTALPSAAPTNSSIQIIAAWVISPHCLPISASVFGDRRRSRQLILHLLGLMDQIWWQ